MNSKTLLGALIAGIVSFLFGWIIFGFLLEDYYNSNVVQYPGLIKNPPDILPIAISNLALGILISWIFNIAKIKTIAKGFSTGLIIGLLTSLCFDLFIYGQMNLYTIKLIIIDVAANGVMGGILGIALGWWFTREFKS
jgi:hypothetical protein